MKENRISEQAPAYVDEFKHLSRIRRSQGFARDRYIFADIPRKVADRTILITLDFTSLCVLPSLYTNTCPT